MKNIMNKIRLKQIVVVCFGTPNISGDSLGPEVGSYLRDVCHINAFVYGTLENPINGKNMTEWMSFIDHCHKDALIISVDASLGDIKKVGKIFLRDDGVCPAGVKGKCSRYGDIGVLGVVGKNTGDALMELMSADKSEIEQFAISIAELISSATKGAAATTSFI